MNIIKLRNKEYKDLKIELLNLLQEQFNLKIQKVSGKFTKFHLLKAVRRNIAKIKTVLEEKYQNNGK